MANEYSEEDGFDMGEYFDEQRVEEKEIDRREPQDPDSRHDIEAEDRLIDRIMEETKCTK